MYAMYLYIIILYIKYMCAEIALKWQKHDVNRNVRPPSATDKLFSLKRSQRNKTNKQTVSSFIPNRHDVDFIVFNCI